MAANEPQKKHLIEWCFVSSREWSNFVSLCRKMISSDRLLTDARRNRHPCMLLECVRIPRACAEIWSSHTAHMNNDLIKNRHFACDGVQIPRACAEKMNLKTVPCRECEIKLSSVYVKRVCEKSTSWCRKMVLTYTPWRFKSNTKAYWGTILWN